jgi:single-stranded-DNA-specific exonuclease
VTQPLPFAPNRPLLGVARSALGRPWRARLDPAGQAQALAMMQHHGLADLLARVLAGRGIAVDEVVAYLDPTLRQLLPDPSSLADMDAAAARLGAAIQAGETIAIFGDYDVDGAASAALLDDFLTATGTPHLIHIPDRIFEGYGPNVQAIAALAEAEATLLVCVDCGTTSHAPLAEARRLGLDVMVLDHHQAPEQLPDALVVNPNRQDDLSGLGQLCAAGVVFLALIAVNRVLRQANFWSAARPAPDLLTGLDLVALATVADVAPLTGLNRAFVTKGLALMRGRERVGLAALFDVAGAGGPPSAHHLGFLIGPRINAGGRIGDAALGAKLLASRDSIAARDIAESLNRLNRERQTVEAATLEIATAEALAAAERTEATAAILVAGDGWHPGVVGLVASQLKERFRRPAFAIAFEGDTGTGSGRSIAGVDLGRAVRAAVEAGLAIKGGGHAMAAGVTLASERLGEWRAFLEERLGGAVAKARADAGLTVDAALTANGATPELAHRLEAAGPYGSGNPEPVFALPRHRLAGVMPVGAGGDHLRLRAIAGDGQAIEGIAFRAAGKTLGQALVRLRDAPVHLAGTLSVNRYGGRERAQLRVVDVAEAAR